MDDIIFIHLLVFIAGMELFLSSCVKTHYEDRYNNNQFAKQTIILLQIFHNLNGGARLLQWQI